MQVEYSEDFKRQVDDEIIRLNGLKDTIETRLEGLRGLLSENAPEVPLKPNKRQYKKRSGPVLRAHDIKDIEKVKSGRLSLEELLAINTANMTESELEKHKKRVYMKRFRMGIHKDPGFKQKMREAKNPGKEGLVRSVKHKRAYTRRRPQPTHTAEGNGTASRFSLDRDFGLDEREIRLMMSYLTSWKGTGRLEAGEIKTLDLFQGRNPVSMPEHDKMLLRDVFYAARGRVQEKTKAASKVE